ncbi:MAG: hypothetical protein MJ168_00690 [Clostridia bacterium]|nr:hypothetical protein [Clostridia bacterium]
MNTKIVKLRGLFSNTKFLVVFSIVCAVIFWVIVATQFSPIVDETIKDVPVTLNSSALSQYGLQGFGADNFKVDITVEGKRYVVGVLSADDFVVTADTAYVDTAGKYTLQIKAVPKDSNSDYNVVELSNSYMEVYFDKLVKNVEVPVEPRIVNSPQKLTEDGLEFNNDDIILTQTTALISGAKTEVDRIKKVYADITIDRTLSVSSTVEAKLSFDDNVKYVDFLNISKNKDNDYIIPVHLCVYKNEKINTDVDIINAPSENLKNFLKYTLSYNELTFSVLQTKDGIELPEKISIGVIDLSKVSPDNKSFKFTAEEISKYVSDNSAIDNGIKYSGTVNSVSANLDTSAFTSTTLTLRNSNLSFSDGNKDKYSFDITPLRHITVVGPKADIAALTSENLQAVVQLGDVKPDSEKKSFPVIFKTGNSEMCWAYGEYNIQVSKK